MSVSYLSMIFVLAFPPSPPHPTDQSLFVHRPLYQQAQQQKQTIFFHLYIFTWILLVLATLGITRLNPGLGGGYLVSAWNFCAGAGCILGAVEAIVASAAWKGYEGYEELRGAEEPHRDGEEVDERTPLIRSENQQTARRFQDEGGSDDLATWWWIPQFLVSVPFPVILLGHIAMLLLDSVPQTLTDGANPWGGE